MTDPTKKLTFIKPVRSPVADEFYGHFAQGKIALQRCSACNSWIHIPREMCFRCGSLNLKWDECSGRAELFTWTDTALAPLPVLAEDVPFVVGLVQLEEGPRVVSRLVNVADVELTPGLKLKVRFDEVDGDTMIATFEPE
ncbi:Zn-ribbon domain-containing OB-fold protein [Gordonia sp. KTR9]|uniref:Zn-ribbon domain-containing OB-fold protein n=1 Tax=Gordonia sp. KTR9 TaxID=337191 RepID=UPI00130D8ACB|nr:OB-fold domain-containing protein [Gordonia sp. KTR9]